MSEIGRELDEARQAGGVPAMTARAAALLADEPFLRAQSADPAARIAEARAALAALEAEARDAWRRYPAVAGGGFHSGPPDLRPTLLNWAVRQVAEAGFYTPDELVRLHETDDVTPAWTAAEALRLHAFLLVLGAATDGFLAQATTATAYVATVKDLASRFRRMAVRRTPAQA